MFPGFEACQTPLQPADSFVPVSDAPPAAEAELKEVHVDQLCRIWQDRAGASSDSEFQMDKIVCHLESRHRSNHLEEKRVEGARRSVAM